MRIAIAGKGGAGKTTISATLSRIEASRGVPVVAIDADSNPNLASALGINLSMMPGVGLPHGLVSRKFAGPALAQTVEEVLGTYSTVGPNDLKLIVMGSPSHAEEGCLCASHAVVSALLADLRQFRKWTIVVDLEASPEHLSRGTARHVDILVLVAEPYYRSLETVRRMAGLATELPIPRVGVLFNKVKNRDDAQAMAEFCSNHGLESFGEVRWSKEVGEADGAASSLFDISPKGETVADISRFSQRLGVIADSIP